MSYDSDPLERIKARMIRPREQASHASIKTALKKAGVGGNKSSPGNGGGPIKGGWASFSAGAPTTAPSKYSRRMIVKVRYVDFAKQQAGAKNIKQQPGYGSAFNSTFSHLGYAQDRPIQQKELQPEVEPDLANATPELNANEQQLGPTSEKQQVGKEPIEPYLDHGNLYNKTGRADAYQFAKQAEDDKRQFRMILSPEDGAQIDLTSFTKKLVRQMEKDLGTKLDWVAANHYNTDNPHVHLVIRGVRDDGTDLLIHPRYIQEGIRNRSVEILDRELGLRTDKDIRTEITKSIGAERYTELDRLIQSRAIGNDRLTIRLKDLEIKSDPFKSTAAVGRVHVLQELGLARESRAGEFSLKEDWQKSLRKLGQRHDMYKQMSEHGYPNVVMIDETVQLRSPVLGKVVKVGYYDELYERKYALLSGTDGKVHYVQLDALGRSPDVNAGDLLKVGSKAPESFLKPSDHNLSDFAHDNPNTPLTRDEFKIWAANSRHIRSHIIDSYTDAHMLRLGHLASKGFVKDDLQGFVVPKDLLEKIKEYDDTVFKKSASRLDLKKLDSVRFDKTILAPGVTTLDKHTLGKADYQLVNTGFGAELNKAVRQRQQFLVQNGFGRFDKGTFIPVDRLLDRLRLNHLQHQISQVPGVLPSHKLDLQIEQMQGTVLGTVEVDTGRFVLVRSQDNTTLAVSRLGRGESFSAGQQVHLRNDIKGRDLSLPAVGKVIDLTKGVAR